MSAPLAGVAGLVVRNTFLENVQQAASDSDSDLDLGPSSFSRAATEPPSILTEKAASQEVDLGVLACLNLTTGLGGGLKRPAKKSSNSLLRAAEEEDSSDFEEPAYIYAAPSGGFQRQTTDEEYFFGNSAQTPMPLPAGGPTVPGAGLGLPWANAGAGGSPAQPYMMHMPQNGMMATPVSTSKGMSGPKDAAVLEPNAALMASAIAANANMSNTQFSAAPMRQQAPLGPGGPDAKAGMPVSRGSPSSADWQNAQSGARWPPTRSANGQQQMQQAPAQRPAAAQTLQQLQQLRPLQPQLLQPLQRTQPQKGQQQSKGSAEWPVQLPTHEAQQSTQPAKAASKQAAVGPVWGPPILQQAVVEAIRTMECSLTLADISIPDQPLIGCSDGFEKLTGYTRSEVLGRNCRFLHKGMSFSASLRKRLREAVQNGTEFLGVLPNLRRNGERFQNLFHLAAIKLRDKTYLVGIQADASHIAVDPRNAGHREAFKDAARRITASHLDAWMLVQAREFSIRLQPSGSELSQQLRTSAGDDDSDGAGGEQTLDDGRGNLVIESADESTTIRRATSGRTSASENSEGKSPNTAVILRSAKTDEKMPGASLATAVPEAPQLQSFGSVGHPDTCTECCFHFFGPAGCRAGADCDYCHEFHPRKNKKKNRRLIRRLTTPNVEEAGGSSELFGVEQGAGVNSGAAGAAAQPGLQGGTDLAAPELAAETVPVHVSSSSGADTFTQPADAAAGSVRPGDAKCDGATMMAVSYCPPPGTISLAVGLKVRLSPKVVCSGEQNLRSCLTFSTEPALPKGLSLDPTTGVISGSPVEIQERSSYAVTISLAARGPGGRVLGAVPVARCTVQISVTDLSCFTLCTSGAGQADVSDNTGPLSFLLEG
mmetsp:Transcript_61185/g.157803  ORF Transcript_61185/g.157803 Transcript_61185/m.157803 type:complete len:882 (+) Transcript_61185:126-2771(+)